MRKCEGKRPLRKPRRKREDDTRIDLKMKGGRMWTGFICVRIGTVVKSVMNFRVP
jgi:hypothetical protein